MYFHHISFARNLLVNSHKNHKIPSPSICGAVALPPHTAGGPVNSRAAGAAPPLSRGVGAGPAGAEARQKRPPGALRLRRMASP